MATDANGVRMNLLKSVCICVLGREMAEKGKDIEVINAYFEVSELE